MLKKYCISQANTIFRKLISDYNFSIILGDNTVTYSSDKIKFSLYLEDYFEINIVFEINKNEFVYLNDILDYINEENEDNGYEYHNQVSTESDVDFVLSNAVNFLKIIFPKIENDSEFLLKVLEYKIVKTNKMYEDCILKEMATEFDKKWQEKDYVGFINVYEKYKQKSITLDTLLAESQKKRLIYSKGKV